MIVDNCNNTSSIRALLQSLDAVPHIRRGIVFTCGTDRRDADIGAQGQALAESFDRIWAYESGSGERPAGSIISLLRQGLERGRRCSIFESHANFEEAFDSATKSLQPGDLVVVQANNIDATLGAVSRLLHGLSPSTNVPSVQVQSADEMSVL
jgi:cyanophycin synthetase